MSRVPHSRALTAAFTAAFAASLLLGGCSSSDAPDATPEATPVAPGSRTPTTQAGSAPSAPGPADASPSSRPDGRHADHGRHKVGALQPRPRESATAHLLGAELLPPLAHGTWAVRATAPDDPAEATPVGTCQKTGLGTIGALETVRRTFRAPGGSAAIQLVARFADSRSAWRAHQVLVAWRDDCEQRVDQATVGPLEPVTVRTGTAESYRASYGATSRAAGLAILRTGSYLTLVEVRAASYPDRWDPARIAVRRVARTF